LKAYSIILNKDYLKKKKQANEFVLTSHSINNGADCVVEALTPTGFVLG